ncbi:hypothetical protein N0V91_010586 [Didymella pomorum]|uniref:Transcription factor domain-containing protein n=1 Tax=Didymella pomorum TaxID=749634 RepID=A0A9W8Z6Y6_9PLEO|nr:hypothetical protein N0V91_010586 [Didymella pomorum]
MGGFGLPSQYSEEHFGLDMHLGNLDDIATYVNLGVVTSASEYKAASLRWWNAAWSLAREMRLGKEMGTPPPDLYDEHAPENLDRRNTGMDPTEEQREERRRMWWLLYTMDRFGAKTDWDEYGKEISQRLDAYGRSLQEMQQRTVHENSANIHDSAPPGAPSGISNPMAQESVMHARIVVTYGTYLMHTLHVLLNGKWDPISLLDDNDLWISSQSFVTATGHAVSAAEALNEILELDPDLSFMPFFFGIYLLQGSFLLLLIADKLQGEASPNIPAKIVRHGNNTTKALKPFFGSTSILSALK